MLPSPVLLRGLPSVVVAEEEAAAEVAWGLKLLEAVAVPVLAAGRVRQVYEDQRKRANSLAG